jgi:hypothetical protein
VNVSSMLGYVGIKGGTGELGSSVKCVLGLA